MCFLVVFVGPFGCDVEIPVGGHEHGKRGMVLGGWAQFDVGIRGVP